MKSKIYDDNFYKDRNEETLYAAKSILSILKQYFNLNSAVDFGCGIGTWLKVFKDLNNNSETCVLGLDGDYVPRKYLAIKNEEFKPTDLAKSIDLPRKFDLAISLEVAEHLPKNRAESFVSDICKSANVVLFSAATMMQGGDGHLNEQRLSYWVELFKQKGFELLDIIRPRFWNDEKISVWYRQNTVIFFNKESVLINDLNLFVDWRGGDVIHPELFEVRSRIALFPIVKFEYKVYGFLLKCLHLFSKK